MGSNDNRHGDKHSGSEWGSKARKRLSSRKKRALEWKSVHDSLESNAEPEEFPNPMHDDSVDAGVGRTIRRRVHKKASKKWCRRKKGREHQWVLIRTMEFYWWRPMEEWKCSACGKIQYRDNIFRSSND